MIIVSFSIDDKDGKYRFFKKIFLFADITMDVTFEMSFLNLSNVYINFKD